MMQNPGLFYHGLGMSMDAVAGGILPFWSIGQ
jgi:hypothetical protein